MGHKEVDNIVKDAGSKDAPIFSEVYKDVATLQRNEKGTRQYNVDLEDLNQQLHKQGILPNVDIIGVDTDHPGKMLLEDKNKAVISKDASSLNNDVGALNSSGLDLDDSRQFADQLLANAFGAKIKTNADGSFDVNAPLLDMIKNPQQAAMGILGTIEKGLLDPGSNSSDTSALESLGMTPMQAQSWKGWDKT